MKEIKIPFNEWSKRKLILGTKIATSRNKRYGEIGDTFKVVFKDFNREDREYQLTAILPLMLSHVGIFLYKIEGAESSKEFHDVWCDIHKRAGWTPEKIVYVHMFEEL